MENILCTISTILCIFVTVYGNNSGITNFGGILDWQYEVEK